jgi:asparagine synthase (glutamine-hydrolysing)
MCGIVGILAFKTSIPDGVLERATASLAHRGPDDSGTILLKQANPEMEIGLGHRRLAIIDLSPLGHQPMRDPMTGNWIIYNGEIYNFIELRRQLEDVGVEFKSHSDTEVILLAYRVWGEACVARLRGMFAFGLWDESKKTITADPRSHGHQAALLLPVSKMFRVCLGGSNPFEHRFGSAQSGFNRDCELSRIWLGL